MNADAFYPPWYWMLIPFVVLFIVLYFTGRRKKNTDK